MAISQFVKWTFASFLACVLTLLAACGGEEAPTQVLRAKALSAAPAAEAASAATVNTVAAASEYETTSEEVLIWARDTYPEYFSGTQIRLSNYVESGVLYPYVDYYRTLKNYVGIRYDDRIFGYGSYTGYSLIDFGNVQDYARLVKEAGYGNKRITVIHVKFPDLPDPFPTSETVRRANAVAEHFKKQSYGKSIQTYTVSPTWEVFAHPSSYYTTRQNELWTELGYEVVNKHLDPKTMDMLIVVMTSLDNVTPGCGAGRNTVTVNGKERFIPGAVLGGTGTIPCANANIMAHEVGHMYGLPSGEGFAHSSMFGCKEVSSWIPTTFTHPTWSEVNCGYFDGDYSAFYGPYVEGDLMGGGMGSLDAFWKFQAGWISPSKLTTVKDSASSISLAPLEVAPTASTAQAVKVPLGNDQNGCPAAYWLEYRSEAELDIENNIWYRSNLGDKVWVWFNLCGVSPNAVPSNGGYTWGSKVFTVQSRLEGPDPFTPEPLTGKLAVGETYHDPYRGVKISRGQNSGKDSAVTVEISKLTLDPPIGALLKAKATQTFVVKNTGTVSITQGTVALKGKHAENFRVTKDLCGSKVLAPGATCSITVEHTRTTGDTGEKFAHLAWSTSDPIRTTPTVGLIGTP